MNRRVHDTYTTPWYNQYMADEIRQRRMSCGFGLGPKLFIAMTIRCTCCTAVCEYSNLHRKNKVDAPNGYPQQHRYIVRKDSLTFIEF